MNLAMTTIIFHLKRNTSSTPTTVTHFKVKRVNMTRTHFFKDESFNNQATQVNLCDQKTSADVSFSWQKQLHE